ncbi:MAG TPA: hypothetical protein VLG16_02235 [Candidatus Saccharimonadales bacterium]|nr:hypothetical protein [Candidatus Saccharimonadales bacterium]
MMNKEPSQTQQQESTIASKVRKAAIAASTGALALLLTACPSSESGSTDQQPVATTPACDVKVDSTNSTGAELSIHWSVPPEHDGTIAYYADDSREPVKGDWLDGTPVGFTGDGHHTAHAKATIPNGGANAASTVIDCESASVTIPKF